MMPIKFKSTHCNYHLFLSVPLPIVAASTSGVRTSFIALFSRMSSLLKSKIKLVLLNYLLSAKSRWFSLREKAIIRICDQTLTHTDNRGVRTYACGCGYKASHSQTNRPKKFKGRFTNAQNGTRREMPVHAHTHRQWNTQSNISGASEVCHLLFGRCEGRICDLCCNYEARLEKMINFFYLHYCPEGSSIGLTHLSIPLHCFSNGNEIECTASWVCLAKTLLSREGTGKKNSICS